MTKLLNTAFQVKRRVLFAIGILTFTQLHPTALAAGPADEAAVRSAWALYNQQKYAASADAFEALIRTSTPNARLYYYAALANKNSNRTARATQLSQYVISYFPGSAEATSLQKLFSGSTSASADMSDSLPASLKGKSVEELMQTEEGRKALKEALNKQKATTSTAAVVGSSKPLITEKHAATRESNQAFTAEAIAEDGSNGISQFISYPDSCFECSLAALAMLPNGRELLARTIRGSSREGAYIVRFPADGVDYTITPKEIEECRVRDKAMWATLIHCAVVMKASGHGTMEEGLSCLTGRQAEKLFPEHTTEQTLTSFIGDAVKSQMPIVCESKDDFGTLPELMENSHGYTIIGFDPATKMITLRDPHGANSRRFRLKTDPEHQKFEQLNGGAFKIHLSLFPQYFSEVVRSPI